MAKERIADKLLSEALRPSRVPKELGVEEVEALELRLRLTELRKRMTARVGLKSRGRRSPPG